MPSNYAKTTPKAAILAVTVLLSLAGVSSAQTVNLTASQQTTTLSDGNTVPMWGWRCGTSVTGSAIGSVTVTSGGSGYAVGSTATFSGGSGTGATAAVNVNPTTGAILSVNITNGGTNYTSPTSITINSTSGPTTAATLTVNLLSAPNCTALTYNTSTGAHNPQTGGTVWQPPLIVVNSAPGGADLTINLTNSLPVETSIVIIGQVPSSATTTNGGLGAPVRESGPRTDGAHAGQTATTWTTVTPSPSFPFTPPTQGARVRSFAPEVAGVASVGNTPATLAYTWTGLKPGTYLIRTGTYPSIQGPMGLYGVLVVTQAPVAGSPGTPGLAYPVPATSTTTGVTYDADVVALESEIDARQNNMVANLFPTACTGVGVPVAACTAAGPLPPGTATANAGFSETAKWTPTCNLLTNTTAATCYPPAVDYTPVYFLINGLDFSTNNQSASALSVPAAVTTGNVLVRYVNAGSHMHVPTFAGLNMLLVAEDGYILPDVALALSRGKTLTANPPAVTSTTATQAVGLQVRNEVFQAAGKVMDVIVSPTQTTTAGTTTFAQRSYVTFDRSLALSSNGEHGVGMEAFLDVNDPNGTFLPKNSITVANPDTYAYAPGVTLTVSDAGKGVIANDVNVYGVRLVQQAATGTITLYPNGTFTYVPTGTAADSFRYCANGTTSTSTPSYCATVTLNVSATANAANAPIANPDSYNSSVASLIRVGAPGVLLNDVDPNGYPMTAALVVPGQAFLTVYLNPDGSFTVTKPAAQACPSTGCTFTYTATNSQNIKSNTATVTLNFQTPSNLTVMVKDAQTGAPITDYKWIIEQDLTLPINPACQVNTGTTAPPANCPALPAGSKVPLTPATQFHASYYPIVAEGCTGPQSCEQGQTVYDAGTPCTTPGVPAGCSPTAGQHVRAACDGYGICNTSLTQLPVTTPDQAHLSAINPDGSPASYYISILSGDSQNAFAYSNTKDPSIAGNCTPGANGNPSSEPTGITESSACGHTMGGGPIPASMCTAGTCTGTVTINLQQNPLKTATVTAYIFEDDYPLNGEPDSGGGIDVLATNEPALGDFAIEVWDDAGGIGDFTGQMTYDMFNEPLTNSLNGTIDPATGFDACPISNTGGVAVGVVIVCPQYESDGKTLSPLTGQVVIKNLMQGKFSLIAHPSAVREANGEEWLQTNSLDGGHYLDSFIRVGEPPYFTEYGPAGYHVFFGFANPKIINARLAAICNGTNTNTAITFVPPCRNTINGQVTNLHQGRSPSEQLYSGAVYPQGDPRNYAMLGYTNCYAALGDSDGATIAFAKCDPNGNFSFTNIPDGNYGLVLFDQWNDLIVDGSSHAVNVTGGQKLNMIYPSFTWQAHLWNRVYMDVGQKGRPVLTSDGSLDPLLSPGLIQVPVRIRQRNGKFVNTLFSDIGGDIHFDETFPLFAFYTVESDNTRFRTTGVHVVNDSGGQVDGPPPVGNGVLSPYQGMLNSIESFPLPSNLSVPGAVYCPARDPACLTTDLSTTHGAAVPSGPGVSTGRIDPGYLTYGNRTFTTIEGWQGGVSEFDLLDWGKTPYLPGENGGIVGHVVNATTRPFDDPRMLFQNLWEPLVPNVTINLYQEGTAPDGSTSVTLVDTTLTSSWDTWAQGFNPTTGMPYMSCTGQDPADPFFSYTMQGTTNYLNPNTALPYASQYKCFDGYHNLNQMQPAPYDGRYQFPSQTCMTPGATFTVAGNPQVYHCATVANPAAGQPGAAPAVLPSSATCAATPRLNCTGRFVTEVVLPPGWQLNKEEDLNLLIGDQYIAPVTQQFPLGLGNIYIVPDQAAINSINPSYTGPYTANGVNGTSGPYKQPFTNCTVPGVTSSCTFTPNTTNNGSPSTDWGRTSFGDFGPGGLIIQSAPCVGRMRVVPDYLSISPESGEVAPFAGSTRPLCDRKEVTLDDQMQATAEFFIYTNTPKATTFTGFISDDFSSEFDPAAPAFGEKFAIPNVPVSIKDFNGQEISRIYSDQWGTFNGLVYSTWEVDPPNITGYSPNMMITCMNDPGPIPGPGGTMITDPFYNPSYSNFCYENAFMPADAEYLDTPVVPTAAFAEGYNPPDCAYPDATPAIKSVKGDQVGGGAGPYIATQTNSFTLTAPGDQPVPNPAYSGPAATTAPYNQKFITRHYGFGAGAKVTVGGVPATCSSGDLAMTCTLPATPLVPLCKASNPSYTGANATARCGEVLVTAANGKQSIDAVTLTIGGKAPTYIAGENAANNALQTAIDQATPGDLIIIGPGTYYEMLIMWKPVRLQGVGAASVTLNANAHPSGKLDPWRRQMACLFGLALNGQPYSTPGNLVPLPGGGGFKPLNLYDPSGQFSCPGTGWVGFSGGPNNPQVDRLPLEGLVGWDTTVNGNLAEFLQEPSLMGAYEGAAISVVGKGVRFPTGVDVFGSGQDNATGSFIAHESQMPVPTVELTGANCTTSATNPTNPYPSSFQCNPSRIDGLTITNSSQGGGGIFVHAWGHNLEISNNRIINNGGTLSGGVTVGQGESPDALLSGNGGDPIGYNGGVLAGFDQQPWTCLPGAVINTTATPYGYDQVVSPPGTTFNQQLPYCYNINVNMHNNDISMNAAYGDELFSSTPAGGGGVTLGTGADYYNFYQNWVCGNLSTGDGGGIAHLGFSWDGNISHNSLLFNQSNNPTITAHGGGIVVMSTAPDGAPASGGAGAECGSVTDADCTPGLGDGTGPGLVIDSNLIMGNTAESGSGGGIRLQLVNGTETALLPKNPELWNSVKVINNIIANNVAGWTGGGVSLVDALIVDFTNNTVVSNDTTASAGVLFSALGAPLASVPPPGQVTTSTPQPAGLVTEHNSANLSQAIASVSVVCPADHPQCTVFSSPVLRNNLFWQNRAFNITTNTSTGASVQLNPALTQSMTDAITNGVVTGGTGACAAGASYWDIGVYSDTAPNNHASGLMLNPVNSILTDAADYPTGNNVAVASPGFVSQYCNGSRVPPEIAPLLCSGANGFANAPGCIQPGQVGVGTTVPGGVPDSLVPPIPAFTLTPAATVDEGSNWINMFYGPLSLTNPVLYTVPGAVLSPLGNYALVSGSPAIDRVPVAVAHPGKDFFGNPRPDPSNPNAFDIGAVEFQTGTGTLSFTSATNATLGTAAPTLTFTIPTPRCSSPAPAPCGPVTSVLTITNTGNAPLTITAETLSTNIGGLYSIPADTCLAASPLAAGATCTISIRYATPRVQPTLPDIGALTVANLGSGTTAGSTRLALSAR